MLLYFTGFNHLAVKLVAYAFREINTGVDYFKCNTENEGLIKQTFRLPCIQKTVMKSQADNTQAKYAAS